MCAHGTTRNRFQTRPSIQQHVTVSLSVRTVVQTSGLPVRSNTVHCNAVLKFVYFTTTWWGSMHDSRCKFQRIRCHTVIWNDNNTFIFTLVVPQVWPFKLPAWIVWIVVTMILYWIDYKLLSLKSVVARLTRQMICCVCAVVPSQENQLAFSTTGVYCSNAHHPPVVLASLGWSA